MQMEIMLTKVIETKFAHNKDAKNNWLPCQAYSYEENPGALSTTELNRRKASDSQMNARFREKLQSTTSDVTGI